MNEYVLRWDDLVSDIGWHDPDMWDNMRLDHLVGWRVHPVHSVVVADGTAARPVMLNLDI